MTTTTKTKKKTTATKNGAASTTNIAPDDAMEAIQAFAKERRNGWRDELRTLWGGEDDGSTLYAARTIVPAAILDNLTFKPAREPKALTPEQDAARRLRRVGTAMRAQARALTERAKELNAIARGLRSKDDAKAVAALMNKHVEGGRLEALEAEVAPAS